MRLAARLSSIVPRLNANIETKAGLSHFEQVFGSARFAAEDANLSARLNWDDQGAAANASYEVGSIRIGLSRGPAAFCIDEISSLNISASGSISRLPESAGFPALAQAPSTCASLPAIPESVQFKASGNYPVGPQESLLRVVRDDGTGIHIQTVQSEVRRLQVNDGRLASMETRTTLGGIGNLQTDGGIRVSANLQQSAESLQMDSELSASDGTRLLDAVMVSTPARLSLDARQFVPADRIIAEVNPILSDLHVNLGSLKPKARINALHADANFENGELLNAAVEARLDRGDIASFESPELRADISTSANGSAPLFSLNVGRASVPNGPRPIVAAVGVPGAQVRAVAERDIVVDAAADLSVFVQGSLYMSGQPAATPVLDKVFDVGSGLSRQASRIASALDLSAAPRPIQNLQWNVHLSQNSPESPFLRITPLALEFHISDASLESSWDSAVPQERNRIAVTNPVHARIDVDGNEVLLGALVPLAIAYSFNGEPESRFDSNIPIQVAFSRELNRSQGNSESLWNEDYYSQFWQAHPPRFSSTVFATPIDFNEVTLGPLLLHGIRFPQEPLRIILGYADALQLGLPFSGRALFGDVKGNVEASMTAANDSATLDTRLNLDMNSIQAGALASNMGGDASAFIEDELDGKVSLRLDSLTLDRTTLPAVRAGHIRAADLEKVGMSVHLARSQNATNLPGVLQASSEFQVHLVNEVLNQLVKNLRLPAPPRALTYDSLALDFVVDRGRVQNDSEVFKLGGIKLFSSGVVDVKGNVRAYMGQPGERIMLGNLVGMIESLGGN